MLNQKILVIDLCKILFWSTYLDARYLLTIILYIINLNNII